MVKLPAWPWPSKRPFWRHSAVTENSTEQADRFARTLQAAARGLSPKAREDLLSGRTNREVQRLVKELVDAFAGSVATDSLLEQLRESVTDSAGK